MRNWFAEQIKFFFCGLLLASQAKRQGEGGELTDL
jgi:hypothetical protein